MSDAHNKLVVFDLDGTLLRSVGVDDDCFARALSDVFGITRFESDWSRYPDATDEGLCEDVPRACGIEPGTDELACFKRRFLELIEQEISRDPSLAAPIEGASEMLGTLSARGWSAAIATGAWRGSALTKLRSSGLISAGLPLATSDDARRRVDIVRTAIGRGEGTDYDRVVCVGDGAWDVRAARDLGLAFVGMADNPAALRAAGAELVLSDYADAEAAIEAFERAPAPGCIGA